MNETAHFFVSLFDGAYRLSVLEILGSEEVHGDADHKDEVNIFELLGFVIFIINFVKYAFHVNGQDNLQLLDAHGC